MQAITLRSDVDVCLLHSAPGERQSFRLRSYDAGRRLESAGLQDGSHDLLIDEVVVNRHDKILAILFLLLAPPSSLRVRRGVWYAKES